MKKTSTRLASIGGIVVLGAFAIALAQHDSRKRDRVGALVEPSLSQRATPIPFDPADEQWEPASSKFVVRANNDLSEELVDGNPLRTADVHERLDGGQVVLAGADQPAPSSPPTGGPPAWLGSSSSAGLSDLPTVDGLGVGPMGTHQPPQMSGPSLPSLPSFPMNASSKPAAEATDLPSLAAPLQTPPAKISSHVGDMSDTQRGAMQATDLRSNQSAQGPFGATTTLPTSGWDSSAAPIAPPDLNAPQASFPAPPTNASLANEGSPALSQSQAFLGGESGRSVFPGTAAPFPSNAAPPGSPNMAPPAIKPDIKDGPQPNQFAPEAWPPGAMTRASERPSAALTALVSNQPGNRYLDGSQNPNMLIQKRAPEEIQVGKKVSFVIAVRNAGNAVAHDVRVVDSVPRGARFIESVPPATPDAQGILTWNLGEMAAGEDRTITLQIVPEIQGEVGSNALVYFAAQASVRTVASLAKLELLLENLPEMLIGSRQKISVVVKNTGTGVARSVRLEADLPELLKHDSGESQLAAGLGDMRPGETQPISLDVAAVHPGQASLAIRAISDDISETQQTVAVNVLAPSLKATIEGPRLRYLERQATYQIKVQNVGTAVATNLDFIVHLPSGLKFNSANNRGAYDPAQHTVSWGLYELPAGAAAPIELTVLPVELGPQAITFSAKADLGLRAEAKGQLMVDGLAELAFSIGQDNGTIEIGASTTYSVQVTNVGNKLDKEVQLTVALPNGTKLMAVDAQVNYRVESNQIVFAPVAEMRNKDQYTFRIQVQHNQPGTQIVRTQLTSANWPLPVIKEEGTLVYNDQD